MSENESKSVVCPGCQAELEFDAEYFAELEGSAIACPECGAEVLIPAAEEVVAPAPKRLSLKGKSAAVAGDGPACPECGNAVDADAVICVNCGTHLASGKPVQTAGGSGSGSRTKAKMSPGRMAVGVISVLVIIGAAANAYLKYHRGQTTKQSQQLSYLIANSRSSHDYAAMEDRLRNGLTEFPLATNRQAAVEALERVQSYLAEVPARTQAMTEAFEKVRLAETPAEKIAILNRALADNPGATNEDEARQMLENLKRR